jgi:hypothetical protein
MKTMQVNTARLSTGGRPPLLDCVNSGNSDPISAHNSSGTKRPLMAFSSMKKKCHCPYPAFSAKISFDRRLQVQAKCENHVQGIDDDCRRSRPENLYSQGAGV